MELNMIILSELHQQLEDEYCMFLLMWKLRNGYFEPRLVITKDQSGWMKGPKALQVTSSDVASETTRVHSPVFYSVRKAGRNVPGKNRVMS